MDELVHNLFHFIHSLSSIISVTNPTGLAVVFILVVFADIGIVIPFIIEPAMFLITFQSGPISEPVLLFLLMMACGRQGGTAILYWTSRFIGTKSGRLISRFFPGFAARFSLRLEQLKKTLGTRQSMVLTMARLTPGLLQVSTIAAGSLRLNYFYVMLGTFVSGFIYDAIIVLMGTLAHYGLQGINPDYSLYIALGVGVLMGLITYVFGRIRRRTGGAPP